MIHLARALLASFLLTAAAHAAELVGRYSHTARSNLDSAGSGASIAVDSFQASVRGATPLSSQLRFTYGLEAARHELDQTGPVVLPDRLTGVGIPVGVAYAQDARWRFLGVVTPRFTGAGDDSISGRGLDVPVLALATFAQNPRTTWSFGLRYSARSSISLLPLVGVAWKFAPGWEATVAFPETGVSYTAAPGLRLLGVATFHGGDFRTHEDPRPLAGRSGPSLRDTWLEYREIRVGFAAEYAVTPQLSVRADVGKAVQQRFEYVDRDLTFEGETPTYVALAVIGRF